jgi:hypothetical protein
MRRHLRGCRRSVDRGAHRPAIEPRKQDRLGCRRVQNHGRQYGRERYASARPTRRGRRPWHVRKLFAWEPGDLGFGRRRDAAGPHRGGEKPKPMMHEPEKSDLVVVAGKSTNKAAQAAAEPVEPRTGTKGNADQQSTRRAQDRVSVSQALERVRQAARQRKKERFTALLHHIGPGMLRTAFYALKRDAAPGVDGMTWQTYEQDLDRRIEDLVARVRSERTGRSHPVGVTFRRKTAASARSRSWRWRTRSSSEPRRRC